MFQKNWWTNLEISFHSRKTSPKCSTLRNYVDFSLNWQFKSFLSLANFNFEESNSSCGLNPSRTFLSLNLRELIRNLHNFNLLFVCRLRREKRKVYSVDLREVKSSGAGSWCESFLIKILTQLSANTSLNVNVSKDEKKWMSFNVRRLNLLAFLCDGSFDKATAVSAARF